jgi:hypothetical protein
MERDGGYLSDARAVTDTPQLNLSGADLWV